jgi:hypothetical protein
MRSTLEEIERRRQDWLDVKEYEQKEKDCQRMAVLLRLESWRAQKMAEKKLQAKKRMIAEEEARYAEMDREDLALAQQELQILQIRDLKDPAFRW